MQTIDPVKGNRAINQHSARKNNSQSQIDDIVSDELKFGLEGLTFDDVLLVPTYSEVLPTPD